MKRVRGFSLVELAIVLVIVGLAIGGMVTPLSVQMEQRRVNDTQRTLDDAREALMGFALRNGYLPCPAVSAQNGLEDRSGVNCRNGRRRGLLPWATLGVAASDAWGRMLEYSVAPAFSDSQSLFGLASPRDITIATRDPSGNLVMATAPNDVPAVVLSHGRNGFGAISSQGIPVAAGTDGNRDERSNADAAGIGFVTRVANDNPASPGGPFDDMLVWISPNILFSRMVAAGVLPH